MLIAFKLKLALACAAGLAGPLAVAPLVSNTSRDSGPVAEQAMVELQPGAISYRVAGDFTRAGQQAEAPLSTLRFAAPLTIMKHQVGASDYQHCVDDGACRARDRGAVIAADRPVVQVSWHDAMAYAGWLSRISGDHYRLPTDEEWAFAAGSRFKDDGLPVDAQDPSKRWIARYERESDRQADDTEAHAFGSFGINENGLLDVGGNVWEWTSTCFVRSELDDADRTLRNNANCGVRVAEGAHRAYVTDFIRDARAGGCAQGLPPSNLGFRLVRDSRSWISSAAAGLSKATGRARS
jgi:formylglycine-generating enzyme required for sulfatase activity